MDDLQLIDILSSLPEEDNCGPGGPVNSQQPSSPISFLFQTEPSAETTHETRFQHPMTGLFITELHGPQISQEVKIN